MRSILHFVPAVALLLFSIHAARGQTVTTVPGFLQDLTGQFPLPDNFMLEQQIQIGTQSNPNIANPFAYGHALQFRPWFHYDGIPNTTLTGSVTYIYYFTVPATNYYRHSEWRDILMATVKQPLPGASLYEQIRGELLNFHDSHGVVQHLPRMRIRFGQNRLPWRGWLKVKQTIPWFVSRGCPAVPATVVFPRDLHQCPVLRRRRIRIGLANSSATGIQGRG